MKPADGRQHAADREADRDLDGLQRDQDDEQDDADDPDRRVLTAQVRGGALHTQLTKNSKTTFGPVATESERVQQHLRHPHIVRCGNRRSLNWLRQHDRPFRIDAIKVAALELVVGRYKSSVDCRVRNTNVRRPSMATMVWSSLQPGAGHVANAVIAYGHAIRRSTPAAPASSRCVSCAGCGALLSARSQHGDFVRLNRRSSLSGKSGEPGRILPLLRTRMTMSDCCSCGDFSAVAAARAKTSLAEPDGGAMFPVNATCWPSDGERRTIFSSGFPAAANGQCNSLWQRLLDPFRCCGRVPDGAVDKSESGYLDAHLPKALSDPGAS